MTIDKKGIHLLTQTSLEVDCALNSFFPKVGGKRDIFMFLLNRSIIFESS
jgi:hypothetical protein